jgi:hypothetical protein
MDRPFRRLPSLFCTVNPKVELHVLLVRPNRNNKKRKHPALGTVGDE